jgi:hypothetical protein
VSGQSSPAVTVTIVLYNSEALLARCLESIRPELESGFAELVAVDCSARMRLRGPLGRERRTIRARGEGVGVGTPS